MGRRLAFPFLGMALALWACSDNTGPGTTTSQEQLEVQAAIDASGLADEDFGELGAVADFSVSAFNLGLTLSPATDTVRAPRFWGRRRERPVRVVRDVVVTGDTARATISRRFQGAFFLRLGADSTAAATTKPLNETLVQRAVLVRVPRDSVVAGDSLKWQLVALSPQEYRATSEVDRTVRITRVTVSVNGQVKIDITDPQALYRVNNQVPRLALGDTVRVAAEVTNTTGGDNFPATFVYLHIDRADSARRWRRERMLPTPNGAFVRTWVVRLGGRARFAVDALDAGTFETAAGNDYRANIWAVPFRIE